MSTINRGCIHLQGLSDKEMDFQLLRQLGTAYQGASVGECFYIANQMKEAQPREWVSHFKALADRLREDGIERLHKNHVISGQSQLLRACNAYRAAEYYAPCSTADHNKLGLQSAECFITALTSMDVHFERQTIPYADIAIPVYFISPANDGVKRKTLMIVSGFDGTMEEEFLCRGLAAVERGYNVIHFAGPGQMDVFRSYPETYFKPDIEQVVNAVLNRFSSRYEVDMDRLALLGISLGGYFATRAACFEPRIRALIANSVILDVHAYLTSFLGDDPIEWPDEDDFTYDALSTFSNEQLSPELKVRCEQLMIRYGRQSFKETFRYLKTFNIESYHLKQLSIPCLTLIGDAEGEEPKKQHDLFNQLVQAQSYVFTDEEGASSHCQVGNISYANAVMYDWLDELFN